MDSCQCEASGFCPVFKRSMPGRLWHLCKTDPRYREAFGKVLVRPDRSGPGTALTQIIKSLGFAYTTSCGCESVAREMDEKGAEWCEQNKSQIADHMVQAAQEHKWAGVFAKLAPGLAKSGALMLVEMAIEKSAHAE